MDAGFTHVVEIGRYCMTWDNGEQFFSRFCRQYILPSNDESSQRKGWNQGNTRIRPVLEVTTSDLYGKSDSGFWAKTTLNLGSEFLMDQINLWWIRTTTQKFLNIYWRTIVTIKCKGFCSRIKGKSKTAKKRSCWLITEHHSDEWNEVDWYWTRELFSLFAYEVSKKVIHFLRHSQKVREDGGAVQFWKIKNYVRNQFSQSIYWSDDHWQACLAAGGGANSRYQYCTDVSGTIIYFWVLQGHSGRNLLSFHYRTMLQFSADFSIIFTSLDVFFFIIFILS